MELQDELEIFIIDDEPGMTEVESVILKDAGVTNFRTFNDPDELLLNLNKNVHICIVDYALNARLDGLELIQEIVKINPHCWFIMVSGQADKRIIIELLNTTYGGRYIEKGGPDDLKDTLVEYVKDLIQHIDYVDRFFRNNRQVQEDLNDLKTLLTS